MPGLQNLYNKLSSKCLFKLFKVLGFTFYEPKDADTDFMSKKNRMFFDGITENLELIKKHYPGWIMRLYYKVNFKF